MKNIKIDKANKLSHYLLSNYNIFMQDENISNWKKNGHGKAVQHSILGLMKSKLKTYANVLDKYTPTTKHCYMCGKVNDVKRYDKIYNDIVKKSQSSLVVDMN